MTRSRFLAVAVAALVAATTAVATLLAEAQPGAKPVRVRVQTSLGDIVLELDPAKAPGTTANFLRYVDAGHYDGGTFHRTVKMDNQPESTDQDRGDPGRGQREGRQVGLPRHPARAHQRHRA